MYGACLSGFDDAFTPSNVTGGYTTSFPSPITRGATFDADLERQLTSAVGDEVRGLFAAKGVGAKSCNGPPGCNLWRDPRWGRNYESYSEDPFLVSMMAVAAVEGLQKGYNEPPTKYLKMEAGARHLGVYSMECYPNPSLPADSPNNTNQYPFCGLDRSGFNAVVDDVDLHETYLPGYKAAVAAGVSSIMCSTNSYNGVPACANDKLLNQLVKQDWGFDGYIDPDDGSCLRVWQSTRGALLPQDGPQFNHNYAHSQYEAIVKCFNGGSDLGDNYGTQGIGIAGAVAAGDVMRSRVRDSTKRQFRIRFRLGEFDPPSLVPWTKIKEEAMGSAANQKLARKVAAAGCVLVQNRKKLLPLPSPQAGPGRRYLLVGPHANYSHAKNKWGTCCNGMPGDIIERYTGKPRDVASLFQAFAARGHAECQHDGGLGSSTSSTSSSGGACGEGSSTVAWTLGYNITNLVPSASRDMIAQAVRMAAHSDIIVVGLGGYQGGESHDRINIGIMLQVEALLKALSATGKPVAAVVYGDGSALSSPVLRDNTDAILSAYVPGETNGFAVADVLFGNVAPSGALPHTVYTPSYAAQVDFLDHGWRGFPGRGDRYIQNRSLVMWPFGWQLSYTDFTLTMLSASPHPTATFDPVASAADADGSLDGTVVIAANQSMVVRVKVENVGGTGGSKPVMLMVRQKGIGMPARAGRWLAAVGNVRDLPPGETQEVELIVKPTTGWGRFETFSQTWQPVPGQYQAMLLSNCCPWCESPGCPPCTCPGTGNAVLDFMVK